MQSHCYELQFSFLIFIENRTNNYHNKDFAFRLALKGRLVNGLCNDLLTRILKSIQFLFHVKSLFSRGFLLVNLFYILIISKWVTNNSLTSPKP